eukprot:TRINITY_DN2201_c0_g1_i20.p1 TRINITY_DN2201_c0_g1~~TRINITY_DN2201_c0_g1_i20.p1  ORF type:complete len:580 (-),score=177.80 TRINITY_DN2201_c0_g1_i20:701-2440(-)
MDDYERPARRTSPKHRSPVNVVLERARSVLAKSQADKSPSPIQTTLGFQQAPGSQQVHYPLDHGGAPARRTPSPYRTSKIIPIRVPLAASPPRSRGASPDQFQPRPQHYDQSHQPYYPQQYQPQQAPPQYQPQQYSQQYYQHDEQSAVTAQRGSPPRRPRTAGDQSAFAQHHTQHQQYYAQYSKAGPSLPVRLQSPYQMSPPQYQEVLREELRSYEEQRDALRQEIMLSFEERDAALEMAANARGERDANLHGVQVLQAQQVHLQEILVNMQHEISRKAKSMKIKNPLVAEREYEERRTIESQQIDKLKAELASVTQRAVKAEDRALQLGQRVSELAEIQQRHLQIKQQLEAEQQRFAEVLKEVAQLRAQAVERPVEKPVEKSDDKPVAKTSGAADKPAKTSEPQVMETSLISIAVHEEVDDGQMTFITQPIGNSDSVGDDTLVPNIAVAVRKPAEARTTTDADAKPAVADVKPAAADAVADAKPAAADAKPAAADAKPAVADTTPAVADAKPAAVADAKPAVADAKPAAAVDAKPAAAADAKPVAVADAKPAAADAKPAAAVDAKPAAVADAKPAAVA